MFINKKITKHLSKQNIAYYLLLNCYVCKLFYLEIYLVIQFLVLINIFKCVDLYILRQYFI